MRRLILIVGFLLASPALLANDTAGSGDSARTMYVVALRAYESGAFETAAALLERSVNLAPDCARCAHLLGKSYGRLAEQADWVQAVALARKTRDALEQAVGIAPNDVEAVEDLIRYYRAAPGFLGGSDKKADALERRLREGMNGRTG